MSVQLTPSQCRWRMLKDVILKKKIVEKNCDSVRSFSSFGLFHYKLCSKSEADNDQWLVCWCRDVTGSKEVAIQRPTGEVHLQDLINFNNTGNVCIWPSEEVMAYYCILHRNEFVGKSIIELGGGSTCLAGLCIAVNTSPGRILLTDGNSKCVESIRKSIKLNSDKLSDVFAGCIRWDDELSYDNHAQQFDYVICADCLFFDEARRSLAESIHTMLKPNGIALVFAPRRGDTLMCFVDICKDMFVTVSVTEDYCDFISDRHKFELKGNKFYKPDIHFPLLIKLHKS